MQAPNFSQFRNFFQAKLEKGFVVPAKTFDNVKGEFPIGFFIWNTKNKIIFENCIVDVYDAKGCFHSLKQITSYDNLEYISKWLEDNTPKTASDHIGHLASVGNDFQNQRMLFIDNEVKSNWKKGGRHTKISKYNMIAVAVYFAVRKVIPATWLNDRDQFLYPNPTWMTDKEFQGDCLAYTLFNNNISVKYGKNNWIPFSENEVNAAEKFDSNFMVDVISNESVEFSEEAKKF